MTRDDEAYIHFQECLTSLNRAWRIIDSLQAASVDPIIGTAAYHMALIEYAKPYKESRGANNRRHFLSPPTLSDSDLTLHFELLRLRDQFLAHSDLTPKEAKVYIGEVGGRPLPLIVSNTDPELPTLEAVRGLIERSLDKLYAQIPDIK